MGIGHYESWAEIFTEFSRHLEKIIKKKKVIWIKVKKYKKSYKLAKKSVSRKKKWKGSVLVVLAQNLFYNWYLCYANLSSKISIENYCENKCQS